VAISAKQLPVARPYFLFQEILVITQATYGQAHKSQAFVDDFTNKGLS